MKRPSIKDGTVAKYVDYLESQLKDYKSDGAINTLYTGVLKQIESIGTIFNNIELDETSLVSNSDKSFDRFMKVSEKLESLVDALIKLEEKINTTKAIEKAKNKKKEAGGAMERALGLGE